MAADYYEGNLSSNTTNAYNKSADVFLSVINIVKDLMPMGPTARISSYHLPGS